VPNVGASGGVEYGASNIGHAIDSSIYRSTKKEIDRTESQ